MKNLIITSLITLFVMSISISAQNRMTPKERAQNLKEKLNLTEEQTQKVDSILTQSSEKMKELRSENKGNREQYRQIMQDTNNEIEKILTADQKQAYEKMLNERRKGMRSRRMNNN